MQRLVRHTHLVQLEHRGLSLPATLAVSIEDEAVHPTHGPALAFVTLHFVLRVIIIMRVTGITITIVARIAVNSRLKHPLEGGRIVKGRLDLQIF